MRLGVSPAAAPTPRGVFNQRFEALFPRAGALGYSVCSAPLCSSRFICVRMWGPSVLPTALPAPISATLNPALSVYLRKCGASGSASGQTACPVHPTLRQSRSCHSHASPLSAPVPASAPPTGLDVCFFFIYLVSDLPAIRFSVSSGCERRRSVSTYAAILVLSDLSFYF